METTKQPRRRKTKALRKQKVQKVAPESFSGLPLLTTRLMCSKLAQKSVEAVYAECTTQKYDNLSTDGPAVLYRKANGSLIKFQGLLKRLNQVVRSRPKSQPVHKQFYQLQLPPQIQFEQSSSKFHQGHENQAFFDLKPQPQIASQNDSEECKQSVLEECIASQEVIWSPQVAHTHLKSSKLGYFEPDESEIQPELLVVVSAVANCDNQPRFEGSVSFQDDPTSISSQLRMLATKVEKNLGLYKDRVSLAESILTTNQINVALLEKKLEESQNEQRISAIKLRDCEVSLQRADSELLAKVAEITTLKMVNRGLRSTLFQVKNLTNFVESHSQIVVGFDEILGSEGGV